MDPNRNITKDQEIKKSNSAILRVKKYKKWIVPVILIIGLVVSGLFTLKVLVSSNAPREDRYQAVFLDNGQVFFGKLKNTHGSYLRLENAYYSKTQELPEDATEEQKAAVANNVSLVKVGDEVYGPESNLSIRSEQVLFWQNLTPDSKVSKAIDSAKE